MNTQYLQRLGQRWYVRVKVPRSLQGLVGNSHVRVALRTTDLVEAHRLKWPVIQRIQEQLDRLRAHHVGLMEEAPAGVPSLSPATPTTVLLPTPAPVCRLPATLTRPMVPELD